MTRFNPSDYSPAQWQARVAAFATYDTLKTAIEESADVDTGISAATDMYDAFKELEGALSTNGSDTHMRIMSIRAFRAALKAKKLADAYQYPSVGDPAKFEGELIHYMEQECGL